MRYIKLTQSGPTDVYLRDDAILMFRPGAPWTIITMDPESGPPVEVQVTESPAEVARLLNGGTGTAAKPAAKRKTTAKSAKRAAKR